MRRSERRRETRETRIVAELVVDGGGQAEVRTGIGFFDHMLATWARHGLFDLRLEADGDLHVDAHHTVEDVGLVLGAAWAEALGDKRGLMRFGEATVPMDEALVRAVVDLSGRPYFHDGVRLPPDQPRLGEWDVALLREFWRAFVTEARLTLHLDRLRGRNAHHLTEAAFKATARALRVAAAPDPRAGDAVPSTKGVL